jgi:hypothetical protein
MREIPLTKGKNTIVDDSDYDFLSQWKWFAQYSRGKFYACRGETVGYNTRVTVQMHRMILYVPPGMVTDHIDGDSLNNQRSNLRICTLNNNNQNAKKRKDNQSGFKGVHWHSPVGKWVARIQIDGKRVNVGFFAQADEAARAYDQAARILHGEFANVNFPYEPSGDYLPANWQSDLARSNTSGYRGVSWDKTNGRWEAKIGYQNKTYHLGRFDSAIEAARAYDAAAKELHGQFAHLNFPVEEPVQ